MQKVVGSSPIIRSTPEGPGNRPFSFGGTRSAMVSSVRELRAHTEGGAARLSLVLIRSKSNIQRGVGLRPVQRERLLSPSLRCDCGKGRLRESGQKTLPPPAPFVRRSTVLPKFLTGPWLGRTLSMRTGRARGIGGTDSSTKPCEPCAQWAAGRPPESATGRAACGFTKSLRCPFRWKPQGEGHRNS